VVRASRPRAESGLRDVGLGGIYIHAVSDTASISLIWNVKQVVILLHSASLVPPLNLQLKIGNWKGMRFNGTLRGKNVNFPNMRKGDWSIYFQRK